MYKKKKKPNDRYIIHTDIKYKIWMLKNIWKISDAFSSPYITGSKAIILYIQELFSLFFSKELHPVSQKVSQTARSISEYKIWWTKILKEQINWKRAQIKWFFLKKSDGLALTIINSISLSVAFKSKGSIWRFNLWKRNGLGNRSVLRLISSYHPVICQPETGDSFFWQMVLHST